MRVNRLFVLAGIGIAAVTGCSRNTVDTNLPPEESTSIRVENENISDMRISIRRAPSGAAYRLGTARGAQTTSLTVPRSIITGVNEVTFEITPLTGGARTFTRTITISPGDTILLRIPPVL
jgi:hypothetical protein